MVSFSALNIMLSLKSTTLRRSTIRYRLFVLSFAIPLSGLAALTSTDVNAASQYDEKIQTIDQVLWTRSEGDIEVSTTIGKYLLDYLSAPCGDYGNYTLYNKFQKFFFINGNVQYPAGYEGDNATDGSVDAGGDGLSLAQELGQGTSDADGDKGKDGVIGLKESRWFEDLGHSEGNSPLYDHDDRNAIKLGMAHFSSSITSPGIAKQPVEDRRLAFDMDRAQSNTMAPDRWQEIYGNSQDASEGNDENQPSGQPSENEEVPSTHRPSRFELEQSSSNKLTPEESKIINALRQSAPHVAGILGILAVCGIYLFAKRLRSKPSNPLGQSSVTKRKSS